MSTVPSSRTDADVQRYRKRCHRCVTSRLAIQSSPSYYPYNHDYPPSSTRPSLRSKLPALIYLPFPSHPPNTASSTGLLLKTAGLKVTAIKIDPYMNIDAGTMAPTEHGACHCLIKINPR